MDRMKDAIDQMIAPLEALVEDGRFIKITAKLYKQLYDALIAEGFGDSVAIAIIKNTEFSKK